VLRSSRLEQGLSLRALAKRVGLSAHSGVAEYERGTRVPPADLIDAYEQALGLPSGYLMNLRQQILRERAKSPIGNSPVLASTPQELAIAPPNHRLAIGVVAAIVFAATAAVIAARGPRITLPSKLHSGRVLVKVCVHSDAGSSA
jgi:transcriptional regulator with XRE-family HTH domain